MRTPLEGSLAVFLGYVLVFPLSLFDFLSNAALNRLSEALRLSQPSDFQATPRLPATLVERLPRRLSDSPTLPDSQRLSPTPSDFRLSTSDFRSLGWGLGTLIPRAAIPPGTPERRAAVTIARIVEDRPLRLARQKHAQTPRLHIGTINKRKSLEKLLTYKRKRLLYECKQKRLRRRRRKRPRSPREGIR